MDAKSVLIRIFGHSRPIFNFAQKLNVSYVGCLAVILQGRCVLVWHPLVFCHGDKISMLEPSECYPALLGANTDSSCSVHFPAVLEDS